MRVLSVVSLFSPDGSYGGPVRVALNQARELRERGHDVLVGGGYRGYSDPPDEVDGVRVAAFPAHQVVPGAGFAGLAVPGLWRWLRRNAAEADVVHVHLARDLVTLPAAALALMSGAPLVLQTHGMIDPSARALARPLDAAATRRILVRAARILYLTERERVDLLSVAGPRIRVAELPNGVPTPRVSARQAEDSDEVLFLARIQSRKRPLQFVHAASDLRSAFPSATFALVGPDEGEGDAVRLAVRGSRGRVQWEGPLAPERTIERMSAAGIYVLPSVDEPFPMTVLEAMSLGKPVVVTDSCGLAQAIDSASAGIVTDGSQRILNESIGRLLGNAELRRTMGENARALVQRLYSMDRVGDELERIYRGCSPAA